MKYETGNSMDPPRPPSWKCILRDYCAAGGPIWMKFSSLMQNSTRLLWFGRSRNRKNSNMADVCFSKP